MASPQIFSRFMSAATGSSLPVCAQEDISVDNPHPGLQGRREGRRSVTEPDLSDFLLVSPTVPATRRNNDRRSVAGSCAVDSLDGTAATRCRLRRPSTLTVSSLSSNADGAMKLAITASGSSKYNTNSSVASCSTTASEAGLCSDEISPRATRNEEQQPRTHTFPKSGGRSFRQSISTALRARDFRLVQQSAGLGLVGASCQEGSLESPPAVVKSAPSLPTEHPAPPPTLPIQSLSPRRRRLANDGQGLLSSQGEVVSQPHPDGTSSPIVAERQSSPSLTSRHKLAHGKFPGSGKCEFLETPQGVISHPSEPTETECSSHLACDVLSETDSEECPPTRCPRFEDLTSLSPSPIRAIAQDLAICGSATGGKRLEAARFVSGRRASFEKTVFGVDSSHQPVPGQIKDMKIKKAEDTDSFVEASCSPASGHSTKVSDDPGKTDPLSNRSSFAPCSSLCDPHFSPRCSFPGKKSSDCMGGVQTSWPLAPLVLPHGKHTSTPSDVIARFSKGIVPASQSAVSASPPPTPVPLIGSGNSIAESSQDGTHAAPLSAAKQCSARTKAKESRAVDRQSIMNIHASKLVAEPLGWTSLELDPLAAVAGAATVGQQIGDAADGAVLGASGASSTSGPLLPHTPRARRRPRPGHLNAASFKTN